MNLLKKRGKNWQHPTETLTNGHIAYLVKFLGVTEAEHPKGIDVVKDCIRKLKLDEEIRRAEGLKTPKAEVTISVDGVAIQEPKGKKILHQFPLHQISYCADDKAEKKYFTFIAKECDSHKCFVFASDKLAEEITLTIGQAFDLAYRRFLDSSGRELELKREIMVLQKRIGELENENTDLKQKLMLNPDTNSTASTSSMSDSSQSVDVDLLFCPPVPPRRNEVTTTEDDRGKFVANQLIAEFAMTANEIEKRANVGRQQDGLLLDVELDSNVLRDGLEAPPKISPPPKGKKPESASAVFSSNNNNISNNNHSNSSSINNLSNGSNGSTSDIFASDPFFTSSSSTSSSPMTTTITDPFGMSDFTAGSNGRQNPNSTITATSVAANGFSSGMKTLNNIMNGGGGGNINTSNNNNNMNNISSSLFSTPPPSSIMSTTPPSMITTNTTQFSNVFNTNTMNMNMLNQFSFQQQQQQQSPVKPSANALQILDKRIEEMKLGFSRGILNDDFPLDQLDPVRKS